MILNLRPWNHLIMKLRRVNQLNIIGPQWVVIHLYNLEANHFALSKIAHLFLNSVYIFFYCISFYLFLLTNKFSLSAIDSLSSSDCHTSLMRINWIIICLDRSWYWGVKCQNIMVPKSGIKARYLNVSIVNFFSP